MTLNDKTAIVTGGTRGIGRAIAVRLARDGARVCVWFRSNTDEARALEAEYPAIVARQVDVTRHAEVTAEVRRLADDWGRIDLLVNAAGIARDALLASMRDEDWAAVLDTNLTGAYHACREVVREMIYAREGRILNVSSLSGITGMAGQTHYAAAKAALIAFTKSLALEVARMGILVNAISPGLVETDLVRAMPETRRNDLVKQIPLGRMAAPDEIAELALFLLSPRNSYITGQNIPITGGLYM